MVNVGSLVETYVCDIAVGSLQGLIDVEKQRKSNDFYELEFEFDGGESEEWKQGWWFDCF